MSADVTVITLTRMRPSLLRRAVESVQNQDYDGSIEHLVMIDHCADSVAALEGVEYQPRRHVRAHLERRNSDQSAAQPWERDRIYPHISRLLNLGVRMSSSHWIAFLDDDNAFEPDHISSLVTCAVRHRAPAVHSFRQVLHADGRPYLDPTFPWAKEPQDAGRIYDVMCRRGVWVRGTNVLRDRAGPWGLTPFRNSTIQTADDPVLIVDTSVWLLQRDLLMMHPWPERYTETDARDNNAPDDMFLEELLKAGVRIVASGKPTLRYYLGGVSN